MRLIFALVLALSASAADIRLLVCGDDGGSSHSINDGTILAFDKGIERCANVIVPGPWFNDIARRLNERPGIGVGVHLTLTSEWDDLKWRPLTRGKTIVDADGYLPSTTRGFLENKPNIAEVEAELRAQIERARRSISQVGWLWPHMGTAVATPELRALTDRLAKEYGLPLLGAASGIKNVRHPQGPDLAIALKDWLQKLEPGTYFFIEHPATDTAEARAMGHVGYTDVALQRAAIVKAWTDPEVKRVIEKRGIELLTPEAARAALQ